MKIKIMGNAVVYTSTAKAEDIKKLQKYQPDVLAMTDEEGNEIFKVGFATIGGYNRYGFTFDSVSRDENGYASLTMCAPDGENIAEVLADEMTEIFRKVSIIEERIPTAVETVNANREAFINQIEIVG